MERKQNIAYLKDNCLNDFDFFTDISQHLSELDVKLQDKGLLVKKQYEHICSIENKWVVFQLPSNKAACSFYVPCLKASKAVVSDLTCTRYMASIQILRKEFANRFVDVDENELKQFAQPFQTAAEDSADC